MHLIKGNLLGYIVLMAVAMGPKQGGTLSFKHNKNNNSLSASTVSTAPPAYSKRKSTT